jgi:hypothetical protein
MMYQSGLLSDHDEDEGENEVNKLYSTHYGCRKKQEEVNHVLGLILNRIEYVDELSDDIEDEYNTESFVLNEKRKARMVDFKTEHTLTYHETIYEILMDSHEAKARSQLIWTKLYGLLEHGIIDSSTREIDDILEKKRAMIPEKLKQIMATNFAEITRSMDELIRVNMRNISDYSLLFKHQLYIDELCLIFFKVEAILDEIEEIQGKLTLM